MAGEQRGQMATTGDEIGLVQVALRMGVQEATKDAT